MALKVVRLIDYRAGHLVDGLLDEQAGRAHARDQGLESLAYGRA